MNESEECDKKLWHSYKEPNKDMGEQDNACECDVSENKSCDLEAHAGCTWEGGVGTKGMWGHVSKESGKMGVES